MISRRRTKKQINMKSETDTIISALRVLARDIHTDDGVVNACLEEAAGRLEELQRANKNTLADLALAVSERTPHDYGILKGEVDNLKRELSESFKERNKTVADLIKQRDEALASARSEPSRLEIAAMFMAAPWCETVHEALDYADKLIAAAKEIE